MERGITLYRDTSSGNGDKIRTDRNKPELR